MPGAPPGCAAPSPHRRAAPSRREPVLTSALSPGCVQGLRRGVGVDQPRQAVRRHPDTREGERAAISCSGRAGARWLACGPRPAPLPVYMFRACLTVARNAGRTAPGLACLLPLVHAPSHPGVLHLPACWRPTTSTTPMPRRWPAAPLRKAPTHFCSFPRQSRGSPPALRPAHRPALRRQALGRATQGLAHAPPSAATGAPTPAAPLAASCSARPPPAPSCLSTALPRARLHKLAPSRAERPSKRIPIRQNECVCLRFVRVHC